MLLLRWFSNSALLRITEELVKTQNLWSFPLKFRLDQVWVPGRGKPSLGCNVDGTTLAEAVCALPEKEGLAAKGFYFSFWVQGFLGIGCPARDYISQPSCTYGTTLQQRNKSEVSWVISQPELKMTYDEGDGVTRWTKHWFPQASNLPLESEFSANQDNLFGTSYEWEINACQIRHYTLGDIKQW